MGYMKSVDIVLTAHKLSDAQKNAVVELLSGGFTTAKPNTIKSLENRGLIINKGDFYLFEESFRAELKEAYSKPEARDNFTEVLGWEPDSRENETDAESLESLLQGDPWKLGDAIMEDEAELEPSDFVAAPFAGWELKVMATNADQFDGKILGIIKDYIATVDGWKGIEVWDSLSLEEIKEDIETATPVNRKARRTHFRTLRNAFRRLNNKQTPDSRKSLKITGKVGV